MSNYSNLAEAIMDYLQEEVEDIEENVKEITDNMTKEALKELKESSRKNFKVHVKGNPYWKGWTKQSINPWGKQKWSKYLSNRKYIIRIHNKTNYQLTHLLEFGHATRNGDYTTPKPHIRPIEEKYNNLYETRLTTCIRTRAYDHKGKERKKVMYKD